MGRRFRAPEEYPRPVSEKALIEAIEAEIIASHDLSAGRN